MSRTKGNAVEVARVERRQQEDKRALERRLDELAEQQRAHRHDTSDRLARIETKLDALLGRPH